MRLACQYSVARIAILGSLPHDGADTAELVEQTSRQWQLWAALPYHVTHAKLQSESKAQLAS